MDRWMGLWVSGWVGDGYIDGWVYMDEWVGG